MVCSKIRCKEQGNYFGGTGNNFPLPFAALFVSHGAPNVILGESPAKHFLQQLPTMLPGKPDAIIVVSAHWETRHPTVSGSKINETIYDFGGFEAELYALRYPAAGAPQLANRVSNLARKAGLEIAIDPSRGLDHGAWVPLMLAWPNADIPVIQLSVQPHAGVEHHLRMGALLRPLTRENILIIGSGSVTHDLRSYVPHRYNAAAAESQWVTAFADWMHNRIVAKDETALVNYRSEAPDAVRNHPTEEHLLPLFVALGASGKQKPPGVLHQSSTHGVLRMDAYAFG